MAPDGGVRELNGGERARLRMDSRTCAPISEKPLLVSPGCVRAFQRHGHHITDARCSCISSTANSTNSLEVAGSPSIASDHALRSGLDRAFREIRDLKRRGGAPKVSDRDVVLLELARELGGAVLYSRCTRATRPAAWYSSSTPASCPVSGKLTRSWRSSVKTCISGSGVSPRSSVTATD